MAQPKRRWSKARTHKRRANWKLEEPKYSKCTNCGEPILPHTACSKCGYYNGKPVITIKEKKED